MHGETPFIAHAMDYATYGRDGHSGARHGGQRRKLYRRERRTEGVKLEDEILMTETGIGTDIALSL